MPLFYQESGAGDLTFVLIHGAGGDHTQLRAQAEHCQQYGRVLSLDLKGHGKSDKPQEDYSIESYAKEIYALCSSLHMTKAIVIGFSMGGPIAIEIENQHKDFVSGLIILDSPLLHSFAMQQMMKVFVHELKYGNFEECLRKVVQMGRVPTDRFTDVMLKSMLQTPRYVWASSMEQMAAWDHKAVSCLAKCRIPILYIEAAHSMIDLPRFKTLCPQLDYGKVADTGHGLPFEAPQQVNAMIDQFLKRHFL